jgi:hypothetical protein
MLKNTFCSAAALQRSAVVVVDDLLLMPTVCWYIMWASRMKQTPAR